MKNLVLSLILLASLGAFAQTQPAIYLTQPFIGNGISQAQNNSQAQAAIGINGAGLSNVVVNALTNGDLRPVVLNNTLSVSNNLSVNSLQNDASGGSQELNADSDNGGFDGGSINIHANANDGNTIEHHLIISTTNSADSSWGTMDLMAGHLNLIGELSVPNAISISGLTYNFTGNFFGNGQWVTNVQLGSNVVGQLPIANAKTVVTNSGVLWTNGIAFARTNMGASLSNSIVGLNSIITNNGATYSNIFALKISTTNLNAESITTNATLAGSQISPQNTNIIKMNLTGTNYLFTQIQDGLWTNADLVSLGDQGGYITNRLGAGFPYQFFQANGDTIRAFSVSVSPSIWQDLFVNQVTKSAWGSLEDLSTSGRMFTNLPGSSVIGIVPASVDSSNLLSIGVPLGSGIFVGSGDGNWKQDLLAAEEDIIGNGFIAGGGSFSGGVFSDSHGSFAASADGGFAGGSFVSTANCYAFADAGCFAGGFFDGSSNVVLTAHDGAFVGCFAITGTNININADPGIVQAHLENAQSVTVSTTSGFFSINASGSSNVVVLGTGVFAANLINQQNVRLQPQDSLLLVPGISNYTNNTISGEIAILTPGGNLYGINTNGFHGNGASITNILVDTVVKTNFLLATDFTNTTTGSIFVKVEARCNPTTTGNALGRLLIDPSASGVFSITNQFGLEADAIFTTAPHKWDNTTAILKAGAHYRIIDVTGEGLFTITNSYWQKLDGN